MREMKEFPEVIYEDNHLLILNKPAGWLVQGDKTGDETLTDWGRQYIKAHYHKPGQVFLHPAHRLDRPVSGLVICCRTSKSLERITTMFRENQIRKQYLAIVLGVPNEPEATLTHWLIKDVSKNVVRGHDYPEEKGKKATLSYHLVANQKSKSLLVVNPTTGRPHQIRVQLSKIGCPIQGDLKYGAPEGNLTLSISLHALKLEFLHPVKKEPFKVSCPPSSLDWDPFKTKIDELVN